MQQANILVNLGNSIYEQKPSKLYEYASTGKPIVNVHYQGIEYREFFDRYKLSLNINQTAGNLHNDVINLQRFCVKMLTMCYPMRKFWKVSRTQHRPTLQVYLNTELRSWLSLKHWNMHNAAAWTVNRLPNNNLT